MRKEKIMWLPAGMLGTLVALLVLGVGGELSAQPKAELRIGIITSMSGPGYAYGMRSALGARFRFEEEINKAGGINGHPVKLFMYDTGTRADQAAMLVERAATVDKVVAMLGPNASSDVAAAFPTANRLGVPCVVMGGTLRGLCEKNAPWGFSAQASDDFSMEPLTLLLDRVKAKQMVVMADAKYNYAVSQGEWGYKIADRMGINVLHDKGKLDVETGWADFTPQVTQIKSLRPDLVCVILFGTDLGHLAVAVKTAGIDPKAVPFYSSVSVIPEFLVGAGPSAEGWYGSAEFDLESTDPVQVAWMKKMGDYCRTMSSDPAIYTVQFNQSGGYDAAAFLGEAIRQAKITPDTPLLEARAKIRDQLPGIRMKTNTSVEYGFGKGGRYEKNRLAKPMFLVQVKEGKIVRVGEIIDK